MESKDVVFGLFLSFLTVGGCYGAGRETFDIFWNSSNHIFRIDNTDHVFTAKIRDRVNIHCPLYNDTVLEEHTEQTIIYMVSKFGYQNCVLEKPKAVGVCRSPYIETVITVRLREFTPSPGKLEFKPGESFYFISTSSGSKEGLTDRKGGLCLKKILKMRFDILPRPQGPLTSSPIEDEGLPTNNLNPRWRNKIPSIPKPERKPASHRFHVVSTTTTREPDLNQFFEKLNHGPHRPSLGDSAPLNESPDWWTPNSAPENGEQDFGESSYSENAVYEIHSERGEEQGGEQLSNTKYWGLMSDEGRTGRSGVAPTKEHLVLFEIEEVDQRGFMNSGSAVSVRLKVIAGCLCVIFLSFLLSWRRE